MGERLRGTRKQAKRPSQTQRLLKGQTPNSVCCSFELNHFTFSLLLHSQLSKHPLHTNNNSKDRKKTNKQKKTSGFELFTMF